MSKGIKFVVPFAPGGSVDPITRILQAKLTEQPGWNIVVENKAGGSGVVGAAVAAKSARTDRPGVPTLIRQGVKSEPSFALWGVFAPAGTPQPIVDRMHAAISKATREPDVTSRFVDQFDMEITLSSPKDFAAFIAREVDLWGKMIRENNLRAG